MPIDFLIKNSVKILKASANCTGEINDIFKHKSRLFIYSNKRIIYKVSQVSADLTLNNIDFICFYFFGTKKCSNGMVFGH